METIKLINFWVSFFASLFTIGTSGLAVYLFIVNKDKIVTAFNLLLNYSKQLTISELKFKVERLNDYTTNDADQKKEIINILSEIEGQIIGNKRIKSDLDVLVKKINGFLENSKTLTEPKKRSLVSELRESIRNIDISNYQNIVK